MTLLYAFENQVIFGIGFMVLFWAKKEEFPLSLKNWGGVLLFIGINFILETWFRWYFKIPSIGAVGYLVS